MALPQLLTHKFDGVEAQDNYLETLWAHVAYARAHKARRRQVAYVDVVLVYDYRGALYSFLASLSLFCVCSIYVRLMKLHVVWDRTCIGYI